MAWEFFQNITRDIRHTLAEKADDAAYRIHPHDPAWRRHELVQAGKGLALSAALLGIGVPAGCFVLYAEVAFMGTPLIVPLAISTVGATAVAAGIGLSLAAESYGTIRGHVAAAAAAPDPGIVTRGMSRLMGLSLKKDFDRAAPRAAAGNDNAPSDTARAAPPSGPARKM